MIIFSNNDAFEVAAMISQYKYPAKAKSGQITDKDITIEAGPTDLMPGPAITELSNVGLKVGVEGGKIAIKVAHTVVKNGEKISKQVAEVISKLGIMPFTIGLKVVALYDSKDKKVFANIDINKDETVKQLISALINARGFAIHIGYPTVETIKRILANASVEEGAIAKLMNSGSATQSESAEQNNQTN
jgi:large subunit ribosomal protein L10